MCVKKSHEKMLCNKFHLVGVRNATSNYEKISLPAINNLFQVIKNKLAVEAGARSRLESPRQ